MQHKQFTANKLLCQQKHGSKDALSWGKNTLSLHKRGQGLTWTWAFREQSPFRESLCPQGTDSCFTIPFSEVSLSLCPCGSRLGTWGMTWLKHGGAELCDSV